MFCRVRCLWSTARNGGRGAEIPTERVFAQWPGPETKYRKVPKQSCSEIFTPNLQEQDALGWGGSFRVLLWSKFSRWALPKLTVTFTNPSAMTFTNPSVSRPRLFLCSVCMSKRFSHKYTSTSTREIPFAPSLFIPRRTYQNPNIPLRLKVHTRQMMSGKKPSKLHCFPRNSLIVCLKKISCLSSKAHHIYFLVHL